MATCRFHLRLNTNRNLTVTTNTIPITLHAKGLLRAHELLIRPELTCNKSTQLHDPSLVTRVGVTTN